MAQKLYTYEGSLHLPEPPTYPDYAQLNFRQALSLINWLTDANNIFIMQEIAEFPKDLPKEAHNLHLQLREKQHKAHAKISIYRQEIEPKFDQILYELLSKNTELGDFLKEQLEVDPDMRQYFTRDLKMGCIEMGYLLGKVRWFYNRQNREKQRAKRQLKLEQAEAEAQNP